MNYKLICPLIAFFLISVYGAARDHGSSCSSEFAHHGYYFPTITKQSQEEAKKIFVPLKSPLAEEFKREILPHLMFQGFDVELKNTPDIDADLIRMAYVKFRDAEINQDKLKKSSILNLKGCFPFEGESPQKYLDRLRHIISNHSDLFPGNALDTFDAFYGEAEGSLRLLYNRGANSLNHTKDSLLRHWINRKILFSPERRSVEAADIWDALKKSGLIHTCIENLEKWDYNPGIAVKQWMERNPGTAVLTLGCGPSFLPSFIQEKEKEIDLLGKFPGVLHHCVSCRDPGNHKNELTVALYEKGAGTSYDGSSHAEILTDISDPRFWQGLGSHQFLIIKDHLGSHDFLNKDQAIKLTQEIESHLEHGGAIQILGREEHNLVYEYLLEKGFRISQRDENLITLTKP